MPQDVRKLVKIPHLSFIRSIRSSFAKMCHKANLTKCIYNSLSRNDNFEEAVGSAMDIGATILKVGLEKVGK